MCSSLWCKFGSPCSTGSAVVAVFVLFAKTLALSIWCGKMVVPFAWCMLPYALDRCHIQLEHLQLALAYAGVVVSVSVWFTAVFSSVCWLSWLLFCVLVCAWCNITSCCSPHVHSGVAIFSLASATPVFVQCVVFQTCLCLCKCSLRVG